MKLMYLYTVEPEHRDAVIARFRATQGRPPEGVTLLGRWTRVDLSGGFALVESQDPQAAAAFALAWSDLAEITTLPVVDDQELNQVLMRAGK
jgi:hypothetical protein